ncbi:hypothetical protein [Mycetocola sp. JXN-3]|uniref:hypothetical protein n=1 Tax=Mycetocola sp. JXN-3 TaxID=2116510 RepID=UPI00165CF86B|nr:hypothetical protein [Mycetocola sp. JXN-3]
MTTPNTPEHGAEHVQRPRRTGLWIGIVVAILVVAGLIIAAVAGAFSGGNNAASVSPRPSVSASASPSATPSAEPSVVPSPSAPTRVSVPTDCRAGFSAGLQKKFAESSQETPLNDPNTSGGGTSDAQLIALIETLHPSLECRWGGPGDSGASTTFSAVDDAQAAIVNARMKANGAECTQAQGGTLCIMPLWTSEENPWAGEGAGILESSFIRDGLWVSTRQINFMKDDYLQDSITTVFGS